MYRPLRLAAALFTMLVAACGGDDGESTAFEGIYQLDSWTHNPDSCDGEGPASIEESSYSHFFVRFDSFFGEEFVAAVTCTNLEECRADAADDDSGWTGSSSILSIGDASCMGSVFQATLTGEAGASVRIDEETKTVADVPLGDDEDCDNEAAYQQASDLPCEQLTVVSGIWLEGI